MKIKKIQKNKDDWTYIKHLAIFMAFLIITLPIYSAKAIAYVNVEVSGRDGVSNVIRETDTLSVTLKTDIPVSGADSRYVKFREDPTYTVFDSCNAANNITTCTFDRSGFFSTGRHTFTTEVWNDLRVLGTNSSYYVVDNQFPSVSIISITDLQTSFAISYLLNDPAPCSGIADLNVLVNSQNRATKLFNSSDCSQSGTINLSKSFFSQGNSQVCINSADRLGQRSDNVCQNNVFVDTTAPQISSIQLYDGSVYDLRYFSNAPKTVTFSVNILTDYAGFNSNLVYANLSGFNPTTDGYDWMQLSCSQVTPTNWSCETNIDVILPSSKTVSVKINSTDDSGNSLSSVKTLGLTYVSSAPTIVDMYTNHKIANGSSYFGRDNILYAKVSSVSPVNSISAVIGSETVTGSCTANNPYVCSFNYSVIGTPTSLNVRVYGTDVTGTYFTQAQTFKADLVSPTVLATYVMSPKKILANGDNIVVTLNLSDSTGSGIDPARASAIFPFISDYSYNGVCTNYEEYAECSFSLNNIPSGQFLINATLYDFAGNPLSLITNKYSLVYFNGTDNLYIENQSAVYQQMTSSVDAWMVSVTSVSPNSIDRQIAGAGIGGAGLTIYALLGYSAKRSNTKILSTEISSCGSPYLDSGSWSVIDAGTTQILVLPLYLQSLKSINSLDVTCNVSTVSIIGGKNITLPEKDSVTFSIPLYNSPLGEMDKNIQSDIELEKKKVSTGLYQMAASIQKFIDVAQKLCKVIKIYRTVVMVYSTMYDFFTILSNGLATPTVANLGKTSSGLTAAKLDISSKDWFRFANKFCLMLDCQVGLAEVTKDFSNGKGVDELGKVDGVKGKSEPQNNNQKKDKKYDTLGAFSEGWNTICGQKNDDRSFAEQFSGQQEFTWDQLMHSNSDDVGIGTGDAKDYVLVMDEEGKPKEAKTPDGISTGKKLYKYDSNRLPADAEKTTEFAQRWLATAGPKQSIFLSIACLCIPGIIYNLNKYRQINCMYIKCLEKTQYGTPKYVCDNMRDYLKCQYFYGEAFNAIPFANFVSEIMKKVQAALSNVVTLMSTLVGTVCSEALMRFAPTNTVPNSFVCQTMKWAEKLSQVACSLGIGSPQCRPFWEMKDDSMGDVCDEVLDKNNSTKSGLFG